MLPSYFTEKGSEIPRDSTKFMQILKGVSCEGLTHSHCSVLSMYFLHLK